MCAQQLVRSWPVVALTIAITVLIGSLGAIGGPGWEPQVPLESITPTSETPKVTTSGGHALKRPQQGAYSVTFQDVEIELDGASVQARVYSPEEAPPGPAVVFIHGAGTVEVDSFADQINAIVSAGIRAIVPAKREDTYSTRYRNYETMARDYLMSWEFLRDFPGVDKNRVGIYGESEGAWIAPVAGVIEPRVEFLVLASAPVVSPREQAAYAAANYLYNTNVPTGLFRAIPRALGAQIPGGGFEYIDFDVTPHMEAVTQPVLMLYGTADASMPIVQGANETRAAMTRGGNSQFTARFFEGADHGLMIDESLASGIGNVLNDWVWGLPETGQPHHVFAGAPPSQRFEATPVPEPRWYASGEFLLYSTLGAVVFTLLSVIVTVVAAIRTQQCGPVVRYSFATVMAAFTPVVLFLWYISEVARLALNYELNNLLVWGGWAVVNISGIFAVAIASASLRQAYLRHRSGQPLPCGVRLGAWGCHLGALGLLLIASYWGVFPAVG